MDWGIHQMDVNATFFNDVLEMELYIDLSEGFVQEEEKHLVCKLQKNFVWALTIAKGVLPLYRLIFHQQRF
jgi:hypothetical protein